VSNEQTVISSPVATQAHTSTGAEGNQRCWRFSARGEWETAPSPWGNVPPDEWLPAQRKRLVFDAGSGRETSPSNARLRVFALDGADTNNPASLLVGELTGVESRPVYYHGSAAWHFLADWPSLPRVVNEFSPLLRFHPEQ
jgi:hypothetical protein